MGNGGRRNGRVRHPHTLIKPRADCMGPLAASTSIARVQRRPGSRDIQAFRRYAKASDQSHLRRQQEEAPEAAEDRNDSWSPNAGSSISSVSMMFASGRDEITHQVDQIDSRSSWEQEEMATGKPYHPPRQPNALVDDDMWEHEWRVDDASFCACVSGDDEYHDLEQQGDGSDYNGHFADMPNEQDISVRQMSSVSHSFFPTSAPTSLSGDPSPSSSSLLSTTLTLPPSIANDPSRVPMARPFGALTYVTASTELSTYSRPFIAITASPSSRHLQPTLPTFAQRLQSPPSKCPPTIGQSYEGDSRGAQTSSFFHTTVFCTPQGETSNIGSAGFIHGSYEQQEQLQQHYDYAQKHPQDPQHRFRDATWSSESSSPPPNGSIRPDFDKESLHLPWSSQDDHCKKHHQQRNLNDNYDDRDQNEHHHRDYQQHPDTSISSFSPPLVKLKTGKSAKKERRPRSPPSRPSPPSITSQLSSSSTKLNPFEVMVDDSRHQGRAARELIDNGTADSRCISDAISIWGLFAPEGGDPSATSDVGDAYTPFLDERDDDGKDLFGLDDGCNSWVHHNSDRQLTLEKEEFDEGDNYDEMVRPATKTLMQFDGETEAHSFLSAQPILVTLPPLSALPTLSSQPTLPTTTSVLAVSPVAPAISETENTTLDPVSQSTANEEVNKEETSGAAPAFVPEVNDPFTTSCDDSPANQPRNDTDNMVDTSTKNKSEDVDKDGDATSVCDEKATNATASQDDTDSIMYTSPNNDEFKDEDEEKEDGDTSPVCGDHPVNAMPQDNTDKIKLNSRITTTQRLATNSIQTIHPCVMTNSQA